ncbi:TonB-dependent receptor [Pontibacter lucknowensis]|uniref:Carboxypeptidase regulatory-like domain-containing protein n=1 Tax=Pontibacter lucknowensis TaxID=1077936 RepID=A0A1N6Y1K5_9BACT|nr:carboxypeptidase-like regulatory domain-containing protein [Pontibacter lucknowensis]SIR08359.1 Carboxypeptidase regulatory-like domain-containing protein [Pontibacter lucknowensis]
MRRLLCCLLLLLPAFALRAQDFRLQGKVRDGQGAPLEYASVVLTSSRDRVQAYSLTGQDGSYALRFTASPGDSLLLTVRLLGYGIFRQYLQPTPQVPDIWVDALLLARVDSLQEIVVEAKRPVTVSQDTLTYNLDFYTDSHEQTVEDVLKKLPGLEVTPDGTIKYGNREILKILIDGDDLAGNQYKVLSKNLDSGLLENIQVLRNYDENPLRKKFGEGDDVVLNLTIKEDKKNILFGKASLGLGSRERYQFQTNLGLLRKRLKILQLGKVNNNGTLAIPPAGVPTAALQDLWARNQQKEAQVRPITGSNAGPPAYLKPEEALRNQSESASLTASHKWGERLRLRSLATYSKDRLLFEQQTLNRFFTGEGPVAYSEQVRTRERSPNLYANTALTYYDQRNWYATFESSFRSGVPAWQQVLLLNGLPVAVSSRDRQQQWSNHLQLTYQASEAFLWESYAYLTAAQGRQHFQVSREGTGKVLGTDAVQNAFQRLGYAGLNTRLRFKSGRRALQVMLGVEDEQDRLQAGINEQAGAGADSLQARRHVRFLNVNQQLQLTWTLQGGQNFRLEAGTTQKLAAIPELNHYYLAKGSAAYAFPVKRAGKFALSYTFNQQLSDLSPFYAGYILESYRTLYGGATAPLRVSSHAVGLTHNYQRPESGFLFFNLLSFVQYDKGYISRSFIGEDFTVHNRAGGKGGELLLFQSQLTRYLSPLQTSFKLESGLSYLLNYLALNTPQLQKSRNFGASAKLSGTTYFDIPVNFRFSAEYRHNRGIFEGNVSQVEDLLLSKLITYKPYEQVLVSAGFNHYLLASHPHSFLSATLDYQPKRSRWEFQLSGQNLLDVRAFSTKRVSDYHLYEQRLDIIRRYGMLTGHYRF